MASVQAWGRLAVEFLAQGEDRGRRELMGREGDVPGRLERREGERLVARLRGVDEDDGAVGRAGEGVLDVELIVGIESDPGEPGRFQAFNERGAQAVVPTPGIADAVRPEPCRPSCSRPRARARNAASGLQPEM